MAVNIVTTEDLNKLKQDLLTEIKGLLTQRSITPQRQYLKSHEVRRMLLISPGTLQNMRVNGTLPFTKIGGVIYYEYDDIKKMLDSNKKNAGAQLTQFGLGRNAL